jgi:response regulator NasT
MIPPVRIAIADDEAGIRDYLEKTLLLLGHEVVITARTGRELVEGCRSLHPDLVITDVKMPDMDGIEASAHLARENPVPVIVVSGYHDADLIRRANAEHVMAYLVKPVRAAQLGPAITVAMNLFAQFQELRQEGAGLREALVERKVIVRAKGILMKRWNLSDSAAFHRLQQLANEKNRKMIDVAQMILAAEESFQKADREAGVAPSREEASSGRPHSPRA